MKYLDYPEQQKHGDRDFPYFFYHVTHMHPRYNMPWHWHPLAEIVHVITGHFQLHLDDRTLLLSPGETAYISPGCIHGGIAMETCGCCYECLLLDLDFIFQASAASRIYESKMLDILNGKRIVIPHFHAAMTDVNSFIHGMLDSIRYKPEGYTLTLEGLTFALFGLIIQKNYLEETSAKKRMKKTGQLKKVMAFIDSHYQEQITLSDLAACANMTANYFCRYFREMTHRPPMDYLNYYRIEAACERLSYTDETITEVAYECGFQDASYFVKVFRRYKHVTPSEYINSVFKA